ncbi:hypothetical protein IQ22_00218 [Pseudomonas duriflava]|uniref:ATPase n=1 Tax=Pseudomonas duriflava TaxID=459528 RepID=A0A562QP27_9PSED|nr:ATPase [Pseudomonas duriflava]TWI58512.1 hypothetical protein IQ22_00218 [Pseudomonas duriflava]
MRNDSFDEFDNVPSLTPDKDLSEDFGRGHGRSARGHREVYQDQGTPETVEPLRASRGTVPVKGASTGPLWALVGAMVIALAGLGWWSHQQIQMMQEQVVATQENFARISEEAAGRLQDISGKLISSESNGTSSREALLLQLKGIETRLAELTRQQQAAVNAQNDLDRRIDQLVTELKTQQAASSGLAERVTALTSEQAALKTAQGELSRYGEQIEALAAQDKNLQADIAALKKQGNPASAIQELQQDLLVLRSELDSRSSGGVDAAVFDTFRVQMTRNISTIQTQLQNMQQQINARR